MRFSVTGEWENCVQTTHRIKGNVDGDSLIAETSQDPSRLFSRDVHLSSRVNELSPPLIIRGEQIKNTGSSYLTRRIKDRSLSMCSQGTEEREGGGT